MMGIILIPTMFLCSRSYMKIAVPTDFIVKKFYYCYWLPNVDLIVKAAKIE